MATAYRFTLAKGSKKYICPGCGKKRFVPYVDTHSGHLLPEQYGRCDRAIKCAYHLNPYAEGYSKLIIGQENDSNINTTISGQAIIRKPPVMAPPVPEPSFIPVDIFKQSRTNYSQNNFIIWLTSLFDTATVNNLISRYFIGTSKLWKGATVFWQVDPSGKIRSGKIMHFCSKTGKRTKYPFDHISWAHRAIKLPDFQLSQCYFGAHLLINNNSPVALVESEKTALIGSVYLPEFIWLAVGSLNNLNLNKCLVLAKRNVYLFPDLNGFDLWSRKSQELAIQMPGTFFKVSDLLERNATEAERSKGLDLADYLLRFNYKDFRQRQLNKSANLTLHPDLSDKSENGEKSEVLKTNISLVVQPDNLTSPLQAVNDQKTVQVQKEYYRFTYSELCQEIGSEKAKQKVKLYQELSERNATLRNWPIHNCQFLTSYSVKTG